MINKNWEERRQRLCSWISKTGRLEKYDEVR